MTILPLYLRFWPTKLWLCAWSASTERKWHDLRITLLYGEHHSKLIFTIKRGIV